MRHRLATALCFAALPAVVARAQDLSVERRSASPQAAARGQVTAIFRTTNRSALPVDLTPRLELPAGWSLVIADSASVLAPNASRVSVFLVSVPAAARPGAFALRFHPTGAAAADSVVALVGERHLIEAIVLASPRFVAAGQLYEASFLVRNAGNGAVTAALRPRAGDARARADSGSVHLEPGDSRTVRVSVQTSEGAPRMLAQTVQLTAGIAGDSAAAVSAAAVVQVIPVGTAEPERFRTLPSQIALVQAGRSGDVTPAISGAGFLRPGSRTRLDFTLRGRQPADAFLGLPDEYWVGLASPGRYRVRLGDSYSRGTRLTESGRAGFGSEGEVLLGGGAVTLGAYAQRDRRSWDFTHEQAAGGGADFRVVTPLRLGAAFAHRTGIDAADIWTTRGSFTPSPLAGLRWEYGQSTGAHGSGAATTLAFSGVAAKGHLGYGARHEEADPGFGGLWRGTRYQDATLSVRLPVIAVGASFANSAGRPLSLLSSVRFDEKIADASVSFGSLLQASYRQREAKGLLFASAPERTTRSLRLQTGIPVGLFRVGAEIESGRSDQLGGVASLPFTRGAARLSATAGRQSMSLGVMRFTGTPSYSATPHAETSVSGGASFRLLGNTSLTVSASGIRTSGIAGAATQTFSLIDVGVAQQLSRGQRARVQARSSSFGPGTLGFDNRSTMQQTEYMLPFALPIGSAMSGGNVEAVLVDARTGLPIAGVLLRLADEARFTDRNGRALFTSLDSGTYYLEADREKIGTGRVVSPVLPLAVKVSGSGTQRVDLRVLAAARVTGRVSRMAFATGRPFGAADSLVDAGPYQGLVVSLVDGDTLRAVVDAFGRFAFDNLHPGAWQLRVIGGVTPDYQLDRTEVKIDLAGGESSDVELHARPVRIAPRFQPTEVIPPASGAPTPPGVAAPVPSPRPANRRPRPTLPPPPPLPVAGPGWNPPVVHHFYTVTSHDVGLMSIARAMYGDASLWPKIWLANLDILRDPGVLHAGQRLRVPDRKPLTAQEQSALEAYRRRRP